MSAPATFESFQQELARLVDRLDREFLHFKSPDFSEASVRADFLDPFFRALGWDVGNAKGLIHNEREVDIGVRTANDAERHALANAPAKTDHDIDQLVYQLYARTPEEIALVEGGGAPAAPSES